MTLSFPTKQTYLDWRNEKRADYRLLARTLRELRIELHDLQSASAHRITEERAQAAAEGRPARWLKLRASVVDRQHTRQYLRARARELMAERQEAKALAIASWETWRQSNQP